MNEISFGREIYGYIIVIFILGGSIVFISVFFKWLRNLFIPSKGIFHRWNRIKLFLFISWPLLIMAAGIWGAYKIGYCYFYSLHIKSNQNITLNYLWPKRKIVIPLDNVSDIYVLQIGRPMEGSKVIAIKTKTGQEFLSVAPETSPESIVDKLKINSDLYGNKKN